jgi:hypothetical protein
MGVSRAVEGVEGLRRGVTGSLTIITRGDADTVAASEPDSSARFPDEEDEPELEREISTEATSSVNSREELATGCAEEMSAATTTGTAFRLIRFSRS